MAWVNCPDRAGYLEYIPPTAPLAERVLKAISGSNLMFEIKRWVRPRYGVVALLYFFSLVQFGSPLFKASAVAAGAYLLMILPLGTRHIERVGLVAICIAAVGWLELIPSDPIGRLASSLSLFK